MKKAAKILSIVLILGVVVCMFASCTKTLNGTYKSTNEVADALNGSLTFDKDGNVTGSLSIPILGEVSVSGTYVIEDDQITMSYTVPILNTTSSKTWSFEKSGGSIFIDGSEFVKAD